MFGDLLKELRTQKKVSQTELARAIGVSNGNVGDWERGRSKPGYDALVALSRYFEISAGRLLELPVASGELTCDDVPLTQMESDVIAMLRLLNPHDRKNAVRTSDRGKRLYLLDIYRRRLQADQRARRRRRQ